jgi:hypothetical protein
VAACAWSAESCQPTSKTRPTPAFSCEGLLGFWAVKYEQSHSQVHDPACVCSDSHCFQECSCREQTPTDPTAQRWCRTTIGCPSIPTTASCPVCGAEGLACHAADASAALDSLSSRTAVQTCCTEAVSASVRDVMA